MNQRPVLRPANARPAPAPMPPFIMICARCRVEHHSTEPNLPEGWAIIVAGVRCPDCKPVAKKAVPHG
ncbi:hypothetical protein [Sphingobium yanoikuyae]|uniref:hypothetical protein n=1 Tax=Sphingobium yanoikuyae TaxID=13690 RepID=UPI000A6BC139|nr:hypothetical protein [Sphingobium yanoikuyae]